MAFTRSQQHVSPTLFHWKAVSASCHQGDISFSESSRGLQCGCNALIALCHAHTKPPQSWQTADMDIILQSGDAWYNSLAPSGPLLVSELPSSVFFNHHHYQVALGEPLTGSVEGAYATTDIFCNLFDGLKKCLSRQPMAFLVCRGYTVAILRSVHDYALVDSHSRNKQGVSDSDGTAVTLLYRSWTSLYNGILQLLTSLGVRGQEPYELVPTGIAISTGQTETQQNKNSTKEGKFQSQKNVKVQHAVHPNAKGITPQRSCTINPVNSTSKETKAEAARRRKAMSRARRTPSQMEQDKLASKQRKANMRTSRAPNQVQEDRATDKRRKVDTRISRLPKYVQEDKLVNKARMSKARGSRAPNQVQEDRATDKRRKVNTRTSRAPNQVQEDRATDKRRKTITHSMQKKSRDTLLQTQEPACASKPAYLTTGIEIVLAEYQAAIGEGSTYICTCCWKQEFRRSVVQVDASKYEKCTKQILDTCLTSQHNEWICKTCHYNLKMGKMPAQAQANSLSMASIPQALKDLCPIECQLICKIIPFMKIVALPKGAQNGFRGQVVLVPSDLSKVTLSLPRQTAESQIITLALKRRLSDAHSVHQQHISPANVNKALAYLKQHNRCYTNVALNSSWQDESANNDSALWQAATDQHDEPSCIDDSRSSSASHCDDNHTEASHSAATQQAQEDIQDSEDEVDNDNTQAIRNHIFRKKSLNATTCMHPTHGPDMTTNQILNIAPGEGQIPVSTYTEPAWEAMAFPKLFPTGENTYHTYNKNRPVKLTAKKYINARLKCHDDRFATSSEYIFQALHWTETLSIQSSIQMAQHKMHHADITAGHLKDPAYVRQLLGNDEMYATFKSIRGTPQYWHQMQLDMLAKLRQLGPYTFFITGSAAEFHWTEIIQVVARQYGEQVTADDVTAMDWKTKRSWLERNPVTTARQIDYIFEQLWGKVILSGAHPVGKILNYDRRKEMQGRGTEHFHAAVHVKDAPRLGTATDGEVVAFVDKYVTCAIPDETTDPILHQLVTTRQAHYHTGTCKKKLGVSCRFNFPRPPSSQTLISRAPDGEQASQKKEQAKAILKKVYKVLTSVDMTMVTEQELLQKADVSNDQYYQALQTSQRRESIVLKRTATGININNYNPVLLRALKANMDIQYITNIWACIAYLTSYMCKPEHTMSELMKKACKEAADKNIKNKLFHIGQVFLKAREVSEHEAIARILSLPLRRSNTPVIFIPTNPKSKRTRMLKPMSKIASMEADDEDIYLPSILDKYSARPNSLEDITLATFASNYVPARHKVESEADTEHDMASEVETDLLATAITLKKDLGKMRKRKSPCIIRYHYISKDNDAEQYYHRLLLMYMSWRDENELKHEDSSYESKFLEVKDTVVPHIQQFEPFHEDVENVLNNFDPDDIQGDIWNAMASEMERERADAHQASSHRDYALLDPDTLEHRDVPETQTQRRRPYALHTTTTYAADTEYYAMVASLNTEQLCLCQYILKWATDTRLASITGTSPGPFHIFLSGGAGVGKTHLVHAIYQTAIRMLRVPGHNPEHPTVLLTASTGKAAANINGTTLHSAFSLPVREKGQSLNYKKPSDERMNTMRALYANLKIIIADEISMFGGSSLEHLSNTLQHITGQNVPFGGISILAVGDLFQLNPVGDRAIFQAPKRNYQALYGSLWTRHFVLHELMQIVRQRSDPTFAQVLSRIRVGEWNDDDISKLTELENTDTSTFPPDVIHLFMTNAQTDAHNEHMLRTLASPKITIKARDSRRDLHTGLSPVTVTSKNVHDTGGLRSEIQVSEGARWILTKNIDLADHLVNGATGTVVNITVDPACPLDGTIYVQFDDERVGQEARKNNPDHLSHAVPIRPITVKFPLAHGSPVPVERTQFPGMLAWALTVHKAQGSTYTHMVGDLTVKHAKMPIQPGLVYTVLSRATSREGLKLVSFREDKIKVNNAALGEIKRMREDNPFPWKHPLSMAPQSSIVIGHLNIRSLLAHSNHLAAGNILQHTDVLCLTETHLADRTHTTYDSDTHVLKVNMTTHGIGMYIRKCCVTENVHVESTGLEAMVYIIHFPKQSVLVITLYRPPAGNKLNFLQALESLLSKLSVKLQQYQVIVTGDFNMDQTGGNHKELRQLMAMHNMHQLISIPTHVQGGILDLIFTNVNDLSGDCFPVCYSDHFLVWTSIKKLASPV
jgi:hypothetical protein